MKLIVDVPEDIYKRINGVLNDGDMHFLRYVVANGIPYENDGDLISRELTLKPYEQLKDADTICVWLIRKNIMQQPSIVRCEEREKGECPFYSG